MKGFEPFDPKARSVRVPVTILGPRGSFDFLFAVDPGSTQTSIRTDFLRQIGYDLTRPVERKRIRSATGSTHVLVYRATSIVSLGQLKSNFMIATQDLPITVEADGLLGLDFFRGLILNLDFARGRVTLRPPSSWWQFWR